MNDMHIHDHIVRRKGYESYRKEVVEETGIGQVTEDVLDIRLVKLLFVSTAAAVVFGISMLLFPL